jgi:hypothetical protein
MEDKMLYAILGAIGTVMFNLLLNIIGNLITPDRKHLADWVRDWWAHRSDKQARKRIKELWENLKVLSEYAEDQRLLSLYVWRTAFEMLTIFSLVAMIALCFLFLEADRLLGLMAFALLAKAYVVCGNTERVLRRVRRYDSYKVEIERQIAELQAG